MCTTTPAKSGFLSKKENFIDNPSPQEAGEEGSQV
jgi:hypothetical protein